MQCLILAGGLGTRIKTIAGDTPKALLPVGPQTFLDWQLQWLKLHGVDNVVLALGFGSQEIMTHVESFQENPEYPQVNYSFDVAPEEGATKEDFIAKLLGTGGAIRKASGHLSPNFIVAYGDSFLFLNLRQLMTEHEQNGKALTLTIYKNANLGDVSNVVYRDGVLEKYDKFNIVPEMEYIDYGMSVVNKNYFLKNTPAGKFDFASFLTDTVNRKKAMPFIAQHIFQEIGSPAGYQKFCELMKNADYDLKKLAEKTMPSTSHGPALMLVPVINGGTVEVGRHSSKPKGNPS